MVDWRATNANSEINAWGLTYSLQNDRSLQSETSNITILEFVRRIQRHEAPLTYRTIFIACFQEACLGLNNGKYFC